MPDPGQASRRDAYHCFSVNPGLERPGYNQGPLRGRKTYAALGEDAAAPEGLDAHLRLSF
jgi:hypothetical protein